MVLAAGLVVFAFVWPKAAVPLVVAALLTCASTFRWLSMRVELGNKELILHNFFGSLHIPREDVVGVRDGQYLRWRSHGRERETLIAAVMSAARPADGSPDGRAKQVLMDRVNDWSRG